MSSEAGAGPVNRLEKVRLRFDERYACASMKGTPMDYTPMPITGFAMDAAMSEDGKTIVAVLTLQTGELTFKFAINEDGARVMSENLQEFLDIAQSRGSRAN
jgi:hypothetical protein